jgi:hypothetical protein
MELGVSAFVTDHFDDYVFSRYVTDAMPTPDSAVAHDDDAVGDREYLGEAVGDKDNRHAAALEDADAIEQAPGLLAGQRRGGLVENEEARILGKRASDYDELLSGKVERRHQGTRIDIEAEIGQRFARAPKALGNIDYAASGRLVVEQDVFGDSEIGNHIDLLWHERDSGLFRFGDTSGLVVPSTDGDRPLIAASRMEAGEDLYQRRFTRAVVANESHDLARGDRQAHIVERHDTREVLGELARNEKRYVGRAAGAGRRLLKIVRGHYDRSSPAYLQVGF